MEITECKIAGMFTVTPRQFADSRGVFMEIFKQGLFADSVGADFSLAQANCSVSAKGVLRGIHFADVPPGQAKYVTCMTGAVLDVVVDIRVGSPTFGQWEAFRLDPIERHAIFIPAGLGHGFCALEDNSTVMYLCDQPYSPTGEHEIDPLDPAIGIQWPDLDLIISDKDKAAPSLAAARDAGLLPTYCGS